LGYRCDSAEGKSYSLWKGKIMGFKIIWSSLMKGWRMEIWDQTTKGGAQERGRCSMRGNSNRCYRSTGVNTDTGLEAAGIGTTDNRSG
jgi:hypothetical protein